MSDSKYIWTAAIAAVLIHLLLVVVLTQDQIVKWLFPKPKVEEKADIEDKAKTKISFRIAPKPKVVPAPLPEPKVEEQLPPPPPDQPQFARTTDQQLQGKPKETTFFGERDTLAQSNGKVDPNAPAVAATRGEKKDYYNATASEYRDGSLEHENDGAPSTLPSQPSPPTPPAPEEQPKVAEESEGEEREPDAGKPLAGSRIPLVDYMDAVKKVRRPERSKTPIEQTDLSEKGKADTGKERDDKEVAQAEEKLQERKKQATPSSQNPEPGLSPKSKTTEMVGSISRRGSVSSNDVKGTPLGRYQQKVQNAIYKEWVRRLGQNRDLILPGAIQIRWYVYDNGKVKIDPYHVRKSLGSEIQFGITFQSITSAKLPKMPDDLKRELKGDPISMVVTFNF